MTRPKRNLEPGYRRGNTTSGLSRRGNRNGRPPDYPLGTELFPILVRVSHREYAIAAILGDGKATVGVRQALSLAAQSLPPGCPQTRDEGIAYGKAQRRTKHFSAAFQKLKYAVAPELPDWDDVTHPPVESNEPPV